VTTTVYIQVGQDYRKINKSY